MDVRLTEQARSAGVLCSTRRQSTHPCAPSKVLVQADGKDVVKKSSLRKGRYLLNLNCQLAGLAAGRLGTLAQLDTRNPVLYINFPEGRLKLFGTLVFPKNKYMVLKFGHKEVLAEDILENMVVFSEAWWVGRALDNPEERKLPLPGSVLNILPKHDPPASVPKTGVRNREGGTQQSLPRPSKRQRLSLVSTSSEEEEEAKQDSSRGASPESCQAPASEPPKARPVRAARAAAATKLKDTSDTDDSSSESQDSE
ncbi:hypothetical protein WJX72_010106 [[Myrmecia] bisecta]|uniref:DNA-binding protein RHL1 n=1 Tax=[Myrmecia] bisecta TaxID=41462 RepID=A0AAW1QG37_9CHLO